MRWVFFFAILATLYSCKEKNKIPGDVLKPEKMKLVFWDILKADALTDEWVRQDSSKDKKTENIKLQQQVFANYKVSKEDFFKSYDFYTQHPDLMSTLLDSVLAYAGRNRYNGMDTVPQLIKKKGLFTKDSLH